MNQNDTNPTFLFLQGHLGMGGVVVEVRGDECPSCTYSEFSRQHFKKCETCGDEVYYVYDEADDILSVFDITRLNKLTLDDFEVFPDSLVELKKLFAENEQLLVESEEDDLFFMIETALHSRGRLRFA